MARGRWSSRGPRTEALPCYFLLDLAKGRVIIAEGALLDLGASDPRAFDAGDVLGIADAAALRRSSFRLYTAPS